MDVLSESESESSFAAFFVGASLTAFFTLIFGFPTSLSESSDESSFTAGYFFFCFSYSFSSESESLSSLLSLSTSN